MLSDCFERGITWFSLPEVNTSYIFQPFCQIIPEVSTMNEKTVMKNSGGIKDTDEGFITDGFGGFIDPTDV